MFAKKEQSCQNNSKNSDTQRKAKDKPSGYLLSLNCSFDETKNRRKFYSRKYRIKKFCNDLKELPTEIVNCEKKEKKPWTDKEIGLYEKQKASHIWKEGFRNDKNKKS